MNREDIRQDDYVSGPLPARVDTPSPDYIRSSGIERQPSPEPITFTELSGEQEFARFVALRELLPERHKLMLTPYRASDYLAGNARLFLAENSGGGYGLLPDGEIVSVFSLPGHRLGRAIIEDALLRGGQRVECFDIANKLPEIYRQFGFVETRRLPWSDSEAPKGWSFDRYGTPDVIIMEFRAKPWG